MKTLPQLPWKAKSLEPYITESTIIFHYGKHHQAYLDNLNKLIENTLWENLSLEEIIIRSEGSIFNNAAQLWNHTFYFESLVSPSLKVSLSPKMAALLSNSFGSVEEFETQFSKAAVSLFGSGWVWLVLNKEGKLEITQESNAGNPLCKQQKPLLTCDIWEHAYYLDYQNRRSDYVQNFWKIVNWEVVERRLFD